MHAEESNQLGMYGHQASLTTRTVLEFAVDPGPVQTPRLRGKSVRIGFIHYNTEEEVDQLLEVLAEMRGT